MRRAPGYLLHATLALLAGLCVPYLTWWSFQASLNADGGLGGALDIGEVLVCSCLLFVATSVVAASGYACSPAPRLVPVYLAASGAAVVLPLMGGIAGGSYRHQEFTRNRRYADEVIGALEQHQAKHGTYPKGLAEVERPLTTTLCRGRYTHKLEYYLDQQGGFVLEHGYGWYRYRYKSARPGWSAHD